MRADLVLGGRNLAAAYEQISRSRAAEVAFGLRLSGSWWWVPHGELLQMIDGVRGGFAALGVGGGDAVAVLLPNCLEWAVACYAAWGRTAVVVPIEVHRPESEWHRILRESGAHTAVAAMPYVASLQRMRHDLPMLRHVITVAPASRDAYSFTAVTETGQRRPVAIVPSNGDLPALRLDRAPSQLTVTHDAVAAAAAAIQAHLGTSSNDRVLTAMAWARHAAALHALISAGATVLVDDGSSTITDILADARPTAIWADATAINRWSEQLAAVGFVGRRCIGTADRVRRGHRPGWVDRHLLQRADRLIPPVRLGPFGGCLPADVGPRTVPESTVTRLSAAFGLTIAAPEALAAVPTACALK